jgi:hypothetical protein
LPDENDTASYADERPAPRRLFWFGALVFCAQALTAGVHAQTKFLEDRAALHAGFARLVFAGKDGAVAVPFTAGMAGQRLKLVFARPVRLDLAVLDRGAKGYAGDFSLSHDGRRLTARLLRPVRLRRAQADPGRLILDLVGIAPGAAKEVKMPPKPASTAVSRSAAAPEEKPPAQRGRIALDIEILPEGAQFSLVFSPDAIVGADAAYVAGRVVVSFDKPIRLSDKMEAVPWELQPLTVASNGKTLSFAVPKALHPEAMGADGKLVIRLLSGGMPQAPAGG